MTDKHREGQGGSPPIEVRQLTPGDAAAVVDLLELSQSTWIHSEGRIRQIAGGPGEALVATSRLSGELVGFLSCAAVAQSILWVRDLCVAPAHPWELVAGALVDGLDPGRTYEVIVRESDNQGADLFRSRGFAGEHNHAERVLMNAFGDEAGIVMRRFGDA